MSRTIELNKPQVSAGADWVLKLPLSYLYHKISLILTNIALADITAIEVKVRSKVIWKISSGTALDMINAYHNRPTQSGELDFWFYSPEMENSAFAALLSLGTADVDYAHIKFRLASGLTNPDIKVLADVDANQPLGLIRKVHEYTHPFGQAGDVTITDWPTQSAAIAAIHLDNNTDLDSVEIRAREDAVQKTGLVAELNNECERYGKVPQSGYTHVDWLLKGNIYHAFQTEGLTGIGDFKAQLSLAAATTITSTIEYIDTLTGV